MLDYASGPTADIYKRERRYTLCAAVLGALYTWSGIFMVFLLPKIPNQDDFAKWLFRGVGLFELVLGLAFFAIVALRYWKPRRCPLILAIMNGIVLAAFPFGTALGIYYFIRLRPYDTQSKFPRTSANETAATPSAPRPSARSTSAGACPSCSFRS